MTSRRTTAATLLVSLALLAACGGSDSDADSDAPPDTTIVTQVTEPVVTEAVVTEAVEPEPTETEPTETEPVVTEPAAPAQTEPVVTEPEPAGPECLVGDWVITEDELNAYYDALEAGFSASGPAPTFDVSGQVLLTFTPTEYVYTGNFDLTLGIAGQEGTGTSTGTVGGTWTTADGVIVAETTKTDLSVSVSIGGVTFDGSELANGLLNDAPINAAPYDCDGPTLGFQTGDGSPRHTVTLTPA
jgi:hypothetical protein